MSERITLIQGDCSNELERIDDSSIDCCVTSPPYWNLRNYGDANGLGMDSSPEKYLGHLCDIFNSIYTKLKPSGTCWVNIGDTYLDKQLLGIPWRFALNLQAVGWVLRQDIVWHKSNAMPESVKDRCTRAHEYIFLLTKSTSYYFDIDAIKEPTEYTGREYTPKEQPEELRIRRGLPLVGERTVRQKKSVWSITHKPSKFPPHHATFPEDLIEPCIKAGCPENGIVLDPFSGTGTTGAVAQRLGCKYIGIEMNDEYLQFSRQRLEQERLF